MESPFTGKTVYVLGAGSSAHTGVPLLADFMVSSRVMMGGRSPLIYDQSYRNVFDWINDIRGSSYYVEVDFDNLEHLFSMAELRRQLGAADRPELCDDLRMLISETIDQRCKLRVSINDGQPHIYPDDTYDQFINKLILLDGKRREMVKPTDPFSRDTIITFNYDVMLDYAMYHSSQKPDYCLNGARAERFKLLKMHGSLNWGLCSQCPEPSVQAVDPTPQAEGQLLTSFTEEASWINFRIVTNTLTNTKCNKCHKAGTLKPLIIPPTWSKAIEGTPLVNVWKTAVEEIKDAFQIVVIGYSMPQTDTFFQYLLALGLSSSPKLHRIIVVNIDDTDNFRRRYEKALSRSLSNRGRLEFDRHNFADFVRNHLEFVVTRL